MVSTHGGSSFGAKQLQKPDVFKYHDFRTFLKDWFSYLKKSKKGWSLRGLAREAGVSHSVLSMLTHGTRKVSDDLWEKVLDHLNLNASEKSYLDHLRVVGDAESHEQRVDALKKIQRFRSYRNLNPDEAEVYRYLTAWYYVAIREMAALADFNADPKEIQKRLKKTVPLSEIQKAVDFLLEKKYLIKDSDGKVHAPENGHDKNIRCFEGIYRISLGKFHREMLALAGEAIDNTTRSEFTLLGRTFSISEDKFEELEALLEEVQSKIKKLEEKDSKKPNVVYHVEIGAFPLTKTKRNEVVKRGGK